MTLLLQKTMGKNPTMKNDQSSIARTTYPHSSRVLKTHKIWDLFLKNQCGQNIGSV